MKTKLVLWGSNDQDERMLIALELRSKENKVNIYTFPEPKVTEEFNQKMMQEWRDGNSVEFPEGYASFESELTVTESILPENVKVERGDLVQRAQTEWHFIVLSSKLNATYLSELDQFKEKVDQLERFDQPIWDGLKQFWNKVQEQVKERNLFKEHADSLRDNTNALFAQLKELRSKLDEEFKQKSQENLESFMAKLEGIDQKIKDGLRLQSIFEDLKKLQREFRETKFTKDHRSKVWQKLDGAFKIIKEKRFGAKGDDKSPSERLNRRYDGLLAAIEKMERSIKRDRDDLEFQNRKIARTDGQLEAQIRQAKILMIEERIKSKEEKLGEMQQTKLELEKRIEQQKVKDEKRLEKQKLEEAKKAAEQKIAEEIKNAAAARELDSDKLNKAAEAISDNNTEAASDDNKTEDGDNQVVEKEIEEKNEPVNQESPNIQEEAIDIVNGIAEEVKENIVPQEEETTEEVVADSNSEEE